MECKATTIDGKPCAAGNIRPSGFCYWHDPDMENERRESRAKGGKNRSSEARAKKAMRKFDSDDLDKILCSVLSGLLAGRFEPGVATASATLVRGITQLRASQDLEVRLAEIEAIVNEARTA